MKTFSELLIRLSGLTIHLGGDPWDTALEGLRPPESSGDAAAIHDMAFRDAKALAGYVPDLRNIMSKTRAAALGPDERRAFAAVYGFYNLASRIPALLLTSGICPEAERLKDLYYGFRSTLAELRAYHELMDAAPNSPEGPPSPEPQS
jgi:hypothetical protein